MMEAMILVKKRAAGMFLFEWHGPVDAPLRISHELMDDPIVRLIPWPLVQVGMTFQGDGIFRRRGNWRVTLLGLRWRWRCWLWRQRENAVLRSYSPGSRSGGE